MLRELTLQNFRVFDEEICLRLRPITVLIGRNSAGKSSLVKFLLMLQQSLGRTEGDFRYCLNSVLQKNLAKPLLHRFAPP